MGSLLASVKAAREAQEKKGEGSATVQRHDRRSHSEDPSKRRTLSPDNLNPDAKEYEPNRNDGSSFGGQMPRKKWKPLASGSFYKDPGERRNDVEEMVLAYLERLKRKASLKQSAKIWRQFNTQQEAFGFADEEDPHGDYLKIFSLELESTGKRKFLVSSYIEFWRRYKDMPDKFRHYYEIIREDCPCNMYLGR